MPEKRKNFTSIIINSANQLLSIVTDILTISALETHQEKVNFSIISINSLIFNLLSVFKIQASSRNVSMFTRQELSEPKSLITTDETKLTQILSNLITNAIKFTHEGTIEFGYTLKETNLEFFVKDTGIGIQESQQETIFERFQQADKSIQYNYGGTGLGLSISKGFVELLGGKIWVESEINKGSTFFFTIPYTPVNEMESNNETENTNLNNATILVAEDEIYNFLYLEEILNNLGINIIHAVNGYDTVEIFKTSGKIDLILMDIKMPVMDGYAAAQIIKKLEPNIPIIAQSAYILENDKIKYSGNAFDDYLTKPINPEKIVELLTKHIYRH